MSTPREYLELTEPMREYIAVQMFISLRDRLAFEWLNLGTPQQYKRAIKHRDELRTELDAEVSE